MTDRIAAIGAALDDTRTMVADYEALLLSSEVNLIPINPSILKNAATLRAQHNLKTPDAIHMASAVASGCAAFLTNDKLLKAPKEIRVLRF